MNGRESTNRALSIAAASWAVVAGCCFYLGRFTPGHEGFEEVGRSIDGKLNGGDHWAYGIGAAIFGVIKNLPEHTPPVGIADEVEHDNDSDEWLDDDGSDYDMDDEVIEYEY